MSIVTSFSKAFRQGRMVACLLGQLCFDCFGFQLDIDMLCTCKAHFQ